MSYFVYILKSLKDSKHYIGSTNNLSRRLFQHNAGLTPSLIYRRPLKVIYTEKFNTREDAERREKEIKAYKGGNSFKKLLSTETVKVG